MPNDASERHFGGLGINVLRAGFGCYIRPSLPCHGRAAKRRPAKAADGRKSMLRLGSWVLMIGIALTVAVRGQSNPPEPEDSRYLFNRVQDGFLRLDTKTGQVSLCSRRTVWTCDVVADDRNAFENEIARLQ